LFFLIFCFSTSLFDEMLDSVFSWLPSVTPLFDFSLFMLVFLFIYVLD